MHQSEFWYRYGITRKVSPTVMMSWRAATGKTRRGEPPEERPFQEDRGFARGGRECRHQRRARRAVQPIRSSRATYSRNGGHEASYRLKFAGVSAARIASTIAAGGRIVSTFRIGRAM